MPSYRSASILLAAVTCTACSAPVVDDVADASGAMTEGVVLVERTVAGDGATQTNVSAKFMRLSAPVDTELAERMVGARLDLPSPGSCRPLASGGVSSGDGRARARDAIGTIELIDVGDLALHVSHADVRADVTDTASADSSPGSAPNASAVRVPLAVRAFPDVGDLVSGMFYTSRDAASDLPGGATYTLEGTGSGAVERFSVDAEAPAALEDVRIGGTALTDGASLDEGAPVTVRWRTAEGAATPRAEPSGDIVLVDVSAESGASFRCSFPDEGKAVLPAWMLRSSTLGALPATATLSVHRIRGRSFALPGIDAGEVRFDLSVMGRVVVTPGSTESSVLRAP